MAAWSRAIHRNYSIDPLSSLSITVDDDSGYDGGSEATQSSVESEISLSDSERKKPCEICGSNANQEKIMTCRLCNVTREHIYCTRVLKSSPTSSSSTSANQDVDQRNMSTSDDSSDKISATHQPSSHARTSQIVEEASSLVPMDTSDYEVKTKKQKLSHSNPPSDTESAN